ncbi:MAG: tRNA (5-methylaminomethyl-2-thiouridine)(34)-methyltransferase MnmD [Bacteroidota bacterium]
MRRQIIKTADGSSTIQIEGWNEQYHSIHGAIQEANHVYIRHGFLFYAEMLKSQNLMVKQNDIDILEVGFGTGLNALLTYLKAESLDLKINYIGVEAFPISSEELSQMNYPEQLQIDGGVLNEMHNCSWEKDQKISKNFTLKKQKKTFDKISDKQAYDVIYFDAFGPRVQPELWTEDIFSKMFGALKLQGVLTTYSAKGSVRRALQTVGFTVERLPGPPGKRHMLRAIKS